METDYQKWYRSVNKSHGAVTSAVDSTHRDGQSSGSDAQNWGEAVRTAMPLSVADPEPTPYARSVATNNERVKRDAFKAVFSYALRAAIQHRGMTYEELGGLVGHPKGTIQRWATGATLPSVWDIAQLADALGVEDSYFVRPPEPTPYPLHDFLREVTQRAEVEGRDRADRPARPLEAPRDSGRMPRRLTRNNG